MHRYMLLEHDRLASDIAALDAQLASAKCGPGLKTRSVHSFLAQLRRHKREMLRDLCLFLGLEADQEYLEACAAIVYDEPEQIRHQLDWTAADRQAVLRRSAGYDFLADYTFEN